MKHLALWLVLAAAGCAPQTKAGAKLREQWKHLTEGPPTFESPGDVSAYAPTPDNGFFGSESTSDCSGCPPR